MSLPNVSARAGPGCFLFTLSAMLLAYSAQGMRERSTHNVQKLARACAWGSIQITKAVFLDSVNSPRFPDRCDASCSPVIQGAEGLSLCVKPKHYYYDSRDTCEVRFTSEELNMVYNALDANYRAERLKEASKELSRRPRYSISYVCLDTGKGVTVDPCSDREPKYWQHKTFTSVYVRPTAPPRSNIADSEDDNDEDDFERKKKKDPPAGAQTCMTVCSLKPQGHYRLKSSFLLKNQAAVGGNNFLEFQTLYSHGVPTAWTRSTGSRFSQNSLLQVGVEELRVRFHLDDLSAVTRLWLSFEGQPGFSISCEREPSGIIILPVTPSEENETAEDNTALAASLGAVGLLAVAALIAFAAYRCRKSGHVFSNSMSTEVLTDTAGTENSRRDPRTQSFLSDEGVYIELDDRDSTYTETNRQSAAVTHHVLWTTRRPCPTVANHHHNSAVNRNETHSDNNGRDTVLYDDPNSSQLDSGSRPPVLAASTTTVSEHENYAMPRIYINAPEDYQPYTSLSHSNA